MESKEQPMFNEQLKELDQRIKEKTYPKGLMGAVQKLKEEGTEEEYEALIKSMFEKLDRKGKRKVISKDVKFSSQVKKVLFKKKA